MSTATADAEILEMSNEQYFADSRNTLSHSELEVFRQSPALYHGQFIRREWVRPGAVHFDVGTVFHSLLLGPQKEITWDTFTGLQTIALWQPCGTPHRKPDFASKKGTKYWRCDDHVIREALNWGSVGFCYWALAGLNGGTVGRCRYDQFLVSDNFIPIPPEVLASDGSRRGSAWTEFAEAHQGQISLREQEFAPLAEMVASVKAHKFAARVLFETPGRNELKLRWKDAGTGLSLRCMIDAPRLAGDCDAPIIADVKTMARMPTPKLFSKIAWDHGYARQAEFYRDAIAALTGDRPPFCFIVALKAPPYTCRVFELSEAYAEEARRQNRHDLERFADAKATDTWRDDDGAVLTVDQPDWTAHTPSWEIPSP